jgi:4-carboxymuconolactone decarboxylase
MQERLAPLRPEQLDSDQRRLYDTIVGGPRGTNGQGSSPVGSDGSLNGPFNAMLLSPDLGQAVQALGAVIRYSSTLTARSREIAILLVAHHCHSAYEWAAHSRHGRQAGLTDAEIESLTGEDPEFADRKETTVARGAVHLLRSGTLPDDVYRASVEILGSAQVFELVTLVGYYRMLAGVLATFGSSPHV